MALVMSNKDMPWLFYASLGTFLKGQVCKLTTGKLALITAKDDEAVAVIAETTMNERTGVARALEDGEGVNAYPLGCGHVVLMSSKKNVTYARDAVVYLSDDVDGDVCATAATSRPVGRIPAWMDEFTTTKDHEPIPVVLNVPRGAALV